MVTFANLGSVRLPSLKFVVLRIRKIRCISVPAHLAMWLQTDITIGQKPDAIWRRKPGRPRKTWISQIQEDVHMSARSYWDASTRRGHGRMTQRSFMTTRSWWWCLSITVFQLFKPQLKKIVVLHTTSFIFCLPWGRPCGNHAKRCMNEKTIQCLPNPSQHVPIYLQQFPVINPSQHVPIYLQQFPVIQMASAKNRCSHVLQPTFLFPLETPLRLSCNMLHEWKDNSMLA